jgi:PrtD family type I secretion system ABC transporter
MAKQHSSPEKKLGLIAWFVSMSRELPGTVWPIMGFSLVSNLLLLVSPLYMLQVYDRILTSGSQDTLIWMTVIAVFLMAIYAAAEIGRRRICALAAERMEEELSERIFANFERRHDAGARLPNDLRVASRIRGFFANQTILPFFDLPFAPLFLAVMFIIHPLIGFLGLAGGVILFTIAVIAEMSNRATNDAASQTSAQAFSLVNGLARQRSAIVSMGLSTPALSKWRATKEKAREYSLKATSHEGKFSSITRSGRQTLQILILGAGGALAVAQQVSPGAIVAGSIILSRALGPIDQIVGSWRGVAAAQSAWNQILSAISEPQKKSNYTPLPRPEAVLKLDRLSVGIPETEAPILRPFMFEATEPQIIGIIGPNGSGKSSLLQTMSGAWSPHGGAVKLGGRDLHKWASADRGQYVGYLPQDVELLPGTVGENISRMQDVEPDKIIAAAKVAGAHEMILALPQGYETQVGVPGIGSLSAGQRQMIGMARALFGKPVLLLLDEPTANLDPASVVQTINRLNAVARSGTLVVVATHDMKLIRAASQLLIVENGSVGNAQTKAYIAASAPRPNLKAVGV